MFQLKPDRSILLLVANRRSRTGHEEGAINTFSVSDTFLTSDPPGDQVFLATFRVVKGDSFAAELADPSTDAFRIRSREYRDRLNLIFRRSWLKLSFLAADVLALDG